MSLTVIYRSPAGPPSNPGAPFFSTFKRVPSFDPRCDGNHNRPDFFNCAHPATPQALAGNFTAFPIATWTALLDGKIPMLRFDNPDAPTPITLLCNLLWVDATALAMPLHTRRQSPSDILQRLREELAQSPGTDHRREPGGSVLAHVG